MKNILIITNADMSLQSGDVVLIKRRAEEFYQQYNAKTTCLILNSISVSPPQKKGIEFFSVEGKEQIKKYLLNIKPEKIIFYGLKSYTYISYVKREVKKLNLTIPILLDLQGAVEEFIEYKKGIDLIANYPKYLVKKKIVLNALNKVNGAIVVSEEMEEYVNSLIDSSRKDFSIYKIRCGITEVLSTETKIKYRETIRKKLSVEEDTIIMTFSGYRMPWQKIDDIISFFKEIDKKNDNIFFAFFCNIDIEFEELIKSSFPQGNYILKFLNSNEYYKYLSACDIGIIIRDFNVTNKVAFPNKFSDYINAGLLVAMNKALPDPIRLLEKNSLEYIDIESPVSDLFVKVNTRQANIKEFYMDSERFCENELLYSKQISETNFMSID